MTAWGVGGRGGGVVSLLESRGFDNVTGHRKSDLDRLYEKFMVL